MHLRRTVVAAALLAATAGVAGAGGAAAYCDPDYRPLCTNDCQMRPPDPKDPLEYFRRVCPD